MKRAMFYRRLAALAFCALAHGVWIAAGWHAAGHVHDIVVYPSAENPSRRVALLDAGDDDDDCPICHTAAAFCEQPSVKSFVLPPAPQAELAFLWFVVAAASRREHSPNNRGPPALVPAPA